MDTTGEAREKDRRFYLSMAPLHLELDPTTVREYTCYLSHQVCGALLWQPQEPLQVHAFIHSRATPGHQAWFTARASELLSQLLVLLPWHLFSI